MRAMVDAVVGQLRRWRLDDGLLDLGRVGGEAEDRPAVAHDLAGDLGAHHLEQLLAIQSVMASLFVDVDRADEVEDQLGRVDHLHRVVAEHPEGDDQPRLGVLHVVDAAAEGLAGVLPGADEVDLGPVGVAVGGPVDDDAEEHDLVGVELVLARAERCRAPGPC